MEVVIEVPSLQDRQREGVKRLACPSYHPLVASEASGELQDLHHHYLAVAVVSTLPVPVVAV